MKPGFKISGARVAIAEVITVAEIIESAK